MYKRKSVTCAKNFFSKHTYYAFRDRKEQHCLHKMISERKMFEEVDRKTKNTKPACFTLCFVAKSWVIFYLKVNIF